LEEFRYTVHGGLVGCAKVKRLSQFYHHPLFFAL
jgi:hypothetical protein